MPKAILVLDEMPNNCSECPCRNEEDFECNNQYKGYIGDYLEWNSGRPSWCRLKPIPEKKNEYQAYVLFPADNRSYVNGVSDGYNKAIDEILGD